MLALILLISLSNLAFANDLIISLTDENFESVTKENPYVMVMFEKPSCDKCREVSLVYEKLAQTAHDLHKPFVFAKMSNVTSNKTINKFGVFMYPSVVFFVKGTDYFYFADLREKDLLIFMNFRANITSIELKTLDEVKEKVDESGFHCILAYSSQNALDVYMMVSQQLEIKHFNFYHTAPELLKKVIPEAKPDDIFLIKDIDQHITLYQDEMSIDRKSVV